MGQSGGLHDKKSFSKERDLTDIVFSWTLEDIFNEDLYKNQVEKIPLQFHSVQQYVMAFIYPLLEDTRAELSTKIAAISNAPFGPVISLEKSKAYKSSLLYDVEASWQRAYRPIPGDIFFITDAKPESMSDLQPLRGVMSFGYNTKVSGDDEGSTRMGTLLTVKVSEELDIKDRPQKLLSVVFLINITTNNRIWKAMHSCGYSKIIKEVTCTNSVVQAKCDMCPPERNEILAEDLNLKPNLNESQLEAVVSSIRNIKCDHRSCVELIWGPPGTGKTRTVSMLVLSLLRLKCRTLNCAPTNVAITEVASRVLKLVKESFQAQFPNYASFCCLGDILLFGNMDRIAFNVEEIHLDYRVEKLVECFGPVTGWKHCFTSMIEFFEAAVAQYQMLCSNQVMYEKQRIPEFEASKLQSISFLKFVRDRYKTAVSALKRCVSILCTHIPKSIILEHNFQHMVLLVAILDTFETLLFRDGLASQELKEIFANQWPVEKPVHDIPEKSNLAYIRSECHRVLTTLFCSLDRLNLPSVLFSDNFGKSFSRLKSVETKNLCLLLLSKLSSGWRPKSNVGISCESSSNILRKFKVGELYIVCSVDIVKESWFIQALKVWDILPLQDIPKLVKHLDNIFRMYTEEYLTRCAVKLHEGNLEVPMRWAPSSHIVQYKSLSNRGNVEPIDAGAVDGKSYVENSKVRDSLLLMKFYSLSSGAVSNLLSSCNGAACFPFELTEQEQEIVLFDKSTFVLGRSGTGKTTVLTMKLFRNEQLYHISSEGFHEVTSNPPNNVGWRYEVNESDGVAKGDILRQLFVTVSPKLCYAVKRHVSQLISSHIGVVTGTIYQQKFGESKLEKAGECFSLAKCHKLAAEAYARSKSYSKSLSACIDGKLFEMGLQYILSWKEQKTFHADKLRAADRSVEDFLQTGALHYYELKDKRTMMRFVKSFHSGDRMRIFLRNLDCLDELLLLEIESKNFLAAADIAKLKEDLVLEADLVEKAGIFREASMLILWHVFTNILHPKTGKGKPSNQYMHKKELLTKAKLIAEKHSDLFYEFVSTEAELLSKGRTAGELLEVGLEFIAHWKSRAPSGLCRINKTSHELEKTEQYLLENCAIHYYDLKDKRTMMKYVKKFESVTFIREFLKGLNCLDELMVLEEELGNFLEAANIAEQKRDILHKADLLEKAGHFEEASLGILWYVLPRSLWVPKSEGWPLKQFHRKDELLTKAISCAKNLPDPICSFVCMEATVLSNTESSLSELRKYLSASQDQNSLRCEILSAWKVLDAHFNLATSKYEWNAALIDNLNKHSEDMISENQVSIETLVHFWNHWKEKIVGLIDYLHGNITRDVSDYAACEEFCLNYFGLQKHFLNKDNVYIVLFPDANWLKTFDPRILRRNGDLVFIESRLFVSAALSYWYSVLHSVGIQVLVTLDALHLYSIKSQFSMFLQSKCLLYTFGIADFLHKFLNRKYGDISNVQKYLELSVENLLGNVFHLDWRSSLTNGMISLRGKASFVDLLKEAISQSIFSKSNLSFGQLGRVLMMILGSRKGTVNLHEEIMRSTEGSSVFWGAFIKMLSHEIGSDNTHGSANTRFSDASNEIFLVWLHNILKDAFYADWRTECDYISPSCFMYLVERLLILASCFQGFVFMTKSSFVEWLIFEEWNINSSSLLANEAELGTIVGDIHDFMASLVQQLLLNNCDMRDWIRKSHDGDENCYPLLVLRFIVLLCLVCVSSGKHFGKLFHLLDQSDVSSQLPRAFCDALGRRKECSFIDALADALKRIENPLVIVSLTDETVVSPSPDAIFLNMKANISSENIFRELFQEKSDAATCSDDHGKDFQLAQPNLSVWLSRH
ncbi:hypothetical protein RJ639_044710 [Escallonia herrerae]|uniref:UvrD-like helicase ATP-binding domain-containing protein n=1 Tax=Escallonia herrerae TaxID=1293975 RepID=A0AA88WBR5_9ASTE|nr:hypothetical protein RJ639_044710 [Escallonia herrerae]